MPAFKKLVLALADRWEESPCRDRDECGADRRGHSGIDEARIRSRRAERRSAARRRQGRCSASSIPQHGGFGRRAKFPHPMELRLLVRIAHRFQGPGRSRHGPKVAARDGDGGIYDQLGGGFHRYSTDERWLVPHFEKMLYDKRAALDGVSRSLPGHRQRLLSRDIEDTLAYVLREMTSPAGAFYSTQDADSEGVEGKFFVWTSQEVESLLGPDDAKLFGSIYDVTPHGNWESKASCTYRAASTVEAKMLNMPLDALKSRLRRSKAKLFEARSKRIWPGRDEKVLTSWNALMIRQLREGGPGAGDTGIRPGRDARRRFLLTTMRREDGRLYRTTFAGHGAEAERVSRRLRLSD